MKIDRTHKGMNLVVVIIDLLVINAWVALCNYGFSLINDANWRLEYNSLAALVTLGYFIGLHFVPIAADKASLHSFTMLRRCVTINAIIAIFYLAMVALLKLEVANLRHNVLVIVTLFALMFIARRIMKHYYRRWHKKHGKIGHIVLIGGSDCMEALYHSLWHESNTMVEGYFSDKKADIPLEHLGDLRDAIGYIKTHDVDEIYCDFSLRHDFVKAVYLYCENNFIRFFGVPDTYAYLDRALVIKEISGVPILAIREEPLTNIGNRILKRVFDIVFSSAVLLLLFLPIYIISAIIIRRTSPGPIFFKQKRTGMNGKDFWCYKFRSMHVNKEADTLQATENDPRKYPYGDFMRRTNIDELPQFINVLKGDMSIVGPRPHMLKHTDEYRELISRYMVRHLAKPGITGWAQVCGLRGATKDLRDMERRVRHDIWYIEHWSFGLDMMIIMKTAMLTLSGKSENAY